MRVLAVVAQDEHQQRVVALAAVSHQLAAGEHRDELALNRALEGDVLHLREPAVERRVPRAAELLGAGRAAQAVAIGLRHIDHPRRAADAAGIGERRDKRPLPLRRPPVMAIGPARDRGELWDGRRGGGADGEGEGVLRRPGTAGLGFGLGQGGLSSGGLGGVEGARSAIGQDMREVGGCRKVVFSPSPICTIESAVFRGHDIR